MKWPRHQHPPPNVNGDEQHCCRQHRRRFTNRFADLISHQKFWPPHSYVEMIMQRSGHDWTFVYFCLGCYKKWLQILRWQCCLISSGEAPTLLWKSGKDSNMGGGTTGTPGLYCFIACTTRCPCKCRQGLPAHTSNPVNGWESILKLPGNFYFNSKNILTEILLLYGEQ